MSERERVMFESPEGVPLKMAENKPRLELVPRFAIEELARVYEAGLNKYSPESWRQFTPEQAQACLLGAALRHLEAYREGERIDAGSGCETLAQAAWNALTLLYHIKRNT